MKHKLLTLLFACALAAPLSAQLNLQLIGHLKYDSTSLGGQSSLAGAWHYVDSTGREYGLIGTSRGLSIVDLTNPSVPDERFFVPGLPSNWREVSTWQGFAYVGTEASPSGITIVDLRELPDTIFYKTWIPYEDSTNLEATRSHTVKAREGFLYIFGGGNISSGATIADLADPWNPVLVGKYTANYVHDGFIRNDTMWTSEIYAGQFAAVDVSDKANPVVLATHPTPAAFNHNTALSADGRYLYTTDEKPNAPLGSFDVSELDNITPLDLYRPSQRPSGEVHNTYLFGDNFLINPSYLGQLTIVDATHPDNLVETAWAIMGNSLVWDANPYLPSGIIFATAKNEGLFIYQPTYVHAAWLEGTVTDAASGAVLAGVQVSINAQPIDTTLTRPDGVYKTGSALAGTYAVTFAKAGYLPQTVPATLQNGEINYLNVALEISTATHAPGRAGVRVFPTRFTDHLNLELTDTPADNATAQLFDAAGRPVRVLPLNGARQTRLDGLQSLPAGTYTLRVVARNGQMTEGHTVIKF